MESKSLKQNSKNKLNPKKGIALVIMSTLFTAIGLTLLKIGIDKFSFSFLSLLNTAFIAGILLYVFSATFLILGLKYGDLSTLYPVISLGYVWVILISVFFFKENVTLLELLGSGAIILGVSILGIKGDSESNKSLLTIKKSNNKQTIK